MLFFSPLLLLLPMKISAQTDCSKESYERCVRIADPLIKEAHLVFPDNMDDIDLVCRTWNRFVDCLKYYTDNCFTEQQRRQFNKAVENPIESVHQMCMQPDFQKGEQNDSWQLDQHLSVGRRRVRRMCARTCDDVFGGGFIKNCIKYQLNKKKTPIFG